MKFKKNISALLATVVAATAFSGFAITANAAAINDGVADGMRVGKVGTGVTADYTDGVLTLSGKGTITSTTGLYGAAVTGSLKDLVIKLEDGADITLQGIDKGSYSYGIYQYGGSVTVRGNGTLTVIAESGTTESVGICTYNGKNGSVYVEDDAKLITKGTGSKGKGINVYHNTFSASNIQLKSGGELISIGEAGAIDVAPLNVGEYEVAEASTSTDGSNLVDFNESDLSTYKYVRFKAVEGEKTVDSGVYVGSKMLTNKGMAIGDVQADYDAKTNEVILSGTGTIASQQINVDGVNTYGAGIFTNNSGTLSVKLADDANITIEGRSHSIYSESYTIYAPNADIKISGNGRLNVKAPEIQSTNQYRVSNAIQTGKGLIVSGATVKAIGLASAGGYGSRGVSAETVLVENDGELIAKGATRAIQTNGSALAYYDTAIVTASNMYDGKIPVTFVNEYASNIKNYKYVSIASPNPKIDYENNGETITFYKDTRLDLSQEKYTEKLDKLFVGWVDADGNGVDNNIIYTKDTVLTAKYMDYNVNGKNDFVVSSAQFRPKNNISEEGLRFIIDVSNDLSTEVTPTEYGAVAIPLEIAGIRDPEIGKTYSYSGKTYSVGKITAEKIFSQNEDGFKYTMCITDLEGKYTRQYVVRGYMKYNDLNGIEKILYTDSFGANAYEATKATLKNSVSSGPNYEALTEALATMEAERAEDKAAYMSQAKTNVVGTSANKTNWVYKLENGLMVREADIDSGKGGEPVEIVQISDIHYNYCNDRDFVENNPIVMNSWNTTTFKKDGESLKNAIPCMKYASYADKTIVTGDTISYLSWGNLELMNKSIWHQDPEALIAIGNHEPRRAMAGSDEDRAAESENYAFLQSQWKHNLYYTSEVVNDKVMVVVMDNQKCKYWDSQYDLLAADIASAREQGIPMLIFEHVAIPSRNPNESAVNAITIGDTSKTTYNFYEGDAYLLKYGKGDAATDRVYNLIVSNGDVIKGIFCGDLHEDMYTEVLATTATGESTIIPQYVLNGAAYDKGHVLKITVR